MKNLCSIYALEFSPNANSPKYESERSPHKDVIGGEVDFVEAIVKLLDDASYMPLSSGLMRYSRALC